MKMNQKQLLLASVALVAASISSPVFAQLTAEPDATTADSENDGEIVVTAQKREQRLLDVPVSVSAVSAETLTSQNLNSIRDYYTRIPGIQLSGTNMQNLSLRGVTAGGLTNPTVAILIDDVQYGSSSYLGNPPIPDLDPATLERVEVLRGPQGTLYGASSLGGLIKFVTRDPSANDFSGRIEIGANTVEDGGQGSSVRGSVNIPIVRDRIGISVSGFLRNDPQYIDSIVGGAVGAGGIYNGGARIEDANKVRVYGGRAALRVNVTEQLSVVASALRQKQKSEGTANIRLCFACSATNFNLDPRYSNIDERTAVAAIVPTTTDISLYTGRVNLDLGSVQLTSVSAWGRNILNNVTDSTSRFGPLLEVVVPVYPAGGTYLFAQPIRTTKFTQELRMAYTGDSFELLGGGFYTKEHSSLSQTIQRTGPGPNVDVYAGNNITSYEEKAVFGDLTYHATDKLDIQVGGRYARNKQFYDVVSVIDVAAQPVFGPGELQEFSSAEKAFTWLVTPSYRFNPDLMTYLRVASGYRPGGPNTATPNAPPTFGNDTVLSYELGLKGQALDRSLTFDMSVFQIDWKDIQLQNTALPSQFVFISNGKKARSRGVEIATTWRPMEGLSIDANAAVLDAALTQSFDRTTALVQRLRGEAGDRLPYSAKITGNISVQKNFKITDDYEAFAGFNVNYIGNRKGLFNQDSASAIYPRVTIPSYTIVDLRAGFSIVDQWQLNMYVRNLFDKKGLTSVETRNGTNLPEGVFVAPRTIGFTVSGQF